MAPPPFISRYLIDWFATQTMQRAQEMVVNEVKTRVEKGDLGDYDGVIFKDAFRSKSADTATTSSGVQLGIVGASKSELVGVLDKIGTSKVTTGNSFKYYTGTWRGMRVAVVETGAGSERAKLGTEALLQAFRPERVACIGFAKSLTDSLKAGVLFVPDRLIKEDGSVLELLQLRIGNSSDFCGNVTNKSQKVKTDSDASETIGDAEHETTNCNKDFNEKDGPQYLMKKVQEGVAEEEISSSSSSDGEQSDSEKSADNSLIDRKLSDFASTTVYSFLQKFKTGSLVSIDREIIGASEKKHFASELGALALDRETWAVAEACVTAGTPFLPLRVIYDIQAQAGSKEAERAIRSEGQSMARTLGAFWGAVAKRPSAALDVYKLKEQALTGADKLANALDKILVFTQHEE